MSNANQPGTKVPNLYAIEYIKRALKSSRIEAPDAKQAGGDLETLTALFESHQKGGADGAKKAWDVLRKVAPHLVKKDRKIKADDLKSIEIPSYAVDGYPIYDLGTNLLIGTRGAGKSFIALDICAKIALKQPNRSVVYCAGEAISAFAPRWEAWKIHNRANPQNLLFWDGALQFTNNEDIFDFLNDFRQDRPCFITVDTVARAMAGLNENDTSVMSSFISRAEEFCKELSAGLLLVHHEGRNGLQRGSSALDGAVDSVISLKREGQSVIMYNDLEHGGKNRHRAETEPVELEFKEVQVSINSTIMSSAVLVMVGQDAQKLSKQQVALLELLGDNAPMEVEEIKKQLGVSRATLYRALTPLKDNGLITYDRLKSTYTVAQVSNNPPTQ